MVKWKRILISKGDFFKIIFMNDIYNEQNVVNSYNTDHI